MAKAFSFQEQVRRTWDFLDKLSRRAWDRDGLTREQQQPVHQAAGNLFSEILGVTRDLPSENALEHTQPPRGVNVDDGQWEQFALNEFVDMVGRRDVRSITDAYLKATSLLKVLDQYDRGYVFRGHRDISWELIPRKGRELKNSDWSPPSDNQQVKPTTTILSEELAALEEFQAKWTELEEVDEIDRVKELPKNNAEWWFRMQHYDHGNGTRLLDVTSSIPAALLFACVNWSTGELDDNQDGVLYLWPVGMNANIEDFLFSPIPDTAEKLFTGYPLAPVFILNPPHNERSKAQSGAFLWWPEFWNPPPSTAPYYLRIPKDAKKSIVTDLLKMGFGPKDAVRGKKGLQNEQKLRNQLGFPAWNPLDLE